MFFRPDPLCIVYADTLVVMGGEGVCVVLVSWIVAQDSKVLDGTEGFT